MPGGRPKDGEAPVSTLKYVPEPEPVEEDPWMVEPTFRSDIIELPEEPKTEAKKSSRRRRKPRNKSGEKLEARVEVKAEPKAEEKPEPREGKSTRSRRGGRGRSKSVKVEAKAHEGAASEKQAAPPKKEQPKKEGSVVRPVKEEGAAHRSNRRRYYRGKPKNKGGGQAQT